MMDLTPLEVRQKKGDFRRALRGYDAELVNDFLDLVADRLEQLVRVNMQMTERVTNLEEQVSEYRDRERAMTEALVTAQEMREELRRQAARDAELSRREAEVEASRIRSDAVTEREREQEAVARLRARRGEMVRMFRAFLERELSDLRTLERSLEGEEPTPVRASPAAEIAAPEPAPPRYAAPARRAAPEPLPDSGEYDLTSVDMGPGGPEDEEPWASEPSASASAAPVQDAGTVGAAEEPAEPPTAREKAARKGRDWLSAILEDRT